MHPAHIDTRRPFFFLHIIRFVFAVHPYAKKGDAMMHGNGTRAALLIVTGLMRTFVSTARHLKQSLIRPNERDGYSFDMIVVTFAREQCSHKDFELGCCTEPLSHSPLWWANMPHDEIRARVQRAYAPYDPPVVFSNASGVAEKLRDAIGLRNLSKYAAIVYVRPDVVLTRTSGVTSIVESQALQLKPVPLRLRELCNAGSSFHFLLASWTRGRAGNHMNRDTCAHPTPPNTQRMQNECKTNVA